MSATLKAEDMGTTTISVPEELADELYARKGRGESYADVIWRLLEAAGEPTPADERQRASAAGTAGTAGTAGEAGTLATTDTTPSRDVGDDREGPSFEDLVTDIAESTLPGSGPKLDERIAAFEAVVEYLREHGTATPREFKEEVYPSHPAQYVDGDDPPTSWWKNAMYKGLRELAEETDRVQRADTTGEWEYVGAADE
jgi:hypothetical protein